MPSPLPAHRLDDVEDADDLRAVPHHVPVAGLPPSQHAVPVDYRMLRRGDRWVAYDVVIEGISLVANYRTQFNAIIRRSSFHELVRKLRDKQDERGTLRTASPS